MQNCDKRHTYSDVMHKVHRTNAMHVHPLHMNLRTFSSKFSSELLSQEAQKSKWLLSVITPNLAKIRSSISIFPVAEYQRTVCSTKAKAVGHYRVELGVIPVFTNNRDPMYGRI